MAYSDRAPTATTPEQVLDGLAGARDQFRRLEQANVVLAVEWAKHHPDPEGPAGDPLPSQGSPPSRFDDRPWVWAELAEMGCLNFDSLSLPEFAIAAGLTEHSARKLLRESLMLVHLLPRVWARVLAGGLDVWRARALAADCWGLPFDAIEFIDLQMSRASVRITQTTRERIVEEAMRLVEPHEALSQEEEAKSRRDVDIGMRAERFGVVPVFAQLDLPDALALEAALMTGAQALKDLGSDASLSVRRSWALGDLARAATGQGSLASGDHTVTNGAPWVAGGALGVESALVGERPHWNGKGASPPQVKMVIELPPGRACPTCSQVERNLHGGPAKVEAQGIAGAVSLDPKSVKEWFTRPTLAGAFMPPVAVRSIVHADEYSATETYSPTERIRDHVKATHAACVFPFCSAPAWKCDIDHAQPWRPEGRGGATCVCNLAPLCRRHHRLKTHSDNSKKSKTGIHSTWDYVHLGGAEYFWRGPRGISFLRTNLGTFEANETGSGGAVPHPQSPITPEDRYKVTRDVVEMLLESAIDPVLAQKATIVSRSAVERSVIDFFAFHSRQRGYPGKSHHPADWHVSAPVEPNGPDGKAAG